MEIQKKNLHMEHVRCECALQTTLEDDRNIPDKNPDAVHILLSKGDIRVEEVRAGQGHVSLRGKLNYHLLYASDERRCPLTRIDGSISFEEQIAMQGVGREDKVLVQSDLEDITVSLINSRKINVQAVIGWKLCVKELTDACFPVELVSMPPTLELKKESRQMTGLHVLTNDVYRIREELELPSNMPNISTILWEKVEPENVTFKVMDGRIAMNGELHAFFIYQGEEEDGAVHYHSGTIPFHGDLECKEASAGMIPVISWEVENVDTEIRPDYDGEKRIFGMDPVMNMRISLYREDSMEVITDLYDTEHEVRTEFRKISVRNLCICNEICSKLCEKISLEKEGGEILQILAQDAGIPVVQSRREGDILRVEGEVNVAVLYVVQEDEVPYRVTTQRVRFSETVDLCGAEEWKVTAGLFEGSVSMLNGHEAEFRARICVKVVGFAKKEEELIDSAELENACAEKMQSLPGAAVVLVEKEDCLWGYGKEYCVSVKKIREYNNLPEGSLPQLGQRLLIVR